MTRYTKIGAADHLWMLTQHIHGLGAPGATEEQERLAAHIGRIVTAHGTSRAMIEDLSECLLLAYEIGRRKGA